MGRLLGIVATGPLAFGSWLRAVRSSSPSLAEEHFDVWRAAVCEEDRGWSLREGAAPAGDDSIFASLASVGPGIALVAHVRARDGRAHPPSLLPVISDPWVLALEGSIEDFSYLASRTAASRSRGARTDGELLLAYFLTRFDEAKVDPKTPARVIDEIVGAASIELTQRIGSMSFVLSNGAALYAHRFDRSLHLLERARRPNEPAAVVVASEPITSESWSLLPSPTLLRCHRADGLAVRFLSGEDPRPPVSDVELPFTD